MTKQLEVGKTYTSENGKEWLCIAINDAVAHMRPAHSPRAAAYAWMLGGTPLTVSADDYRIVFEPERGELVLHGSSQSFFWPNRSLSDAHRLRLPTLDGELATGIYIGPDGHRIKVEKL